MTTFIWICVWTYFAAIVWEVVKEARRQKKHGERKATSIPAPPPPEPKPPSPTITNIQVTLHQHNNYIVVSQAQNEEGAEVHRKSKQ